MYAAILIGLILSIMPAEGSIKPVFLTKNAEFTLFSGAPI